MDAAQARLWEYFVQCLLQEARKKSIEEDTSGGGGGLSAIGGMVGGAGGGKNFNTAEIHVQQGQDHMQKREFSQAIECFKTASNWYSLSLWICVLSPRFCLNDFFSYVESSSSVVC